MSTSIFKSIVFLFTIILLSPACTSTIEDDTSPSSDVTSLSEMETNGWIHSAIEFNGSGFDAACSDVSVVLTSGGNSQAIGVQSCENNKITAWIPDTMEGGVYDVALTVGDDTFTSIDGNDLQVEVKIRPVILSISPTSVIPGGIITVTGSHIINDTSISQFDPMVWISTTNFSNNVSEITVNEAGTSATIIISESMTPGPGEYEIKLSCVEWSNEMVLNIL